MIIESGSTLSRLRRHAARRGLADPTLAAAERLSRAKAFILLEKRFQQRLHQKGAGGATVAAERAAMVDVLLESLWAPAARLAGGLGDGEASLVALGGYGRGELCPHSDIDILFLWASDLTESRRAVLAEKLVDGVLYPLWDLGFKVGHATRTIGETMAESRANILSKIALLETRLIAGGPRLYEDFLSVMGGETRGEGFAGETVRHLLDEQDRRREKHGDSVFVQEPDVKNGVGGLRDIHTLVWLGRILHAAGSPDELARLGWITHEEAMRLVECRSFLLRVRHELHYGSARPTETLTLEKQPVIAANLGYAEADWVERVEHFMRDYYAAAEFVWRTVRDAEWRLQRPSAGRSYALASPRVAPEPGDGRTDAFLIEAGLVYARDAGVFEEDPVRLLRVFNHAQRRGARLSPELVRLIREKSSLLTRRHACSPEAHRAFWAILSESGVVYPALNAMRDLGVLTRYLPEFAAMICLVQHELYHRYTADIHTLLCIKELDAVLAGESPASEPYREAILDCEEPTLLYLTLLLHDIGKPLGIRGHAESGVRVAAPFLERLGVSGGRRELVEFVIRAHLDMSAYWQRHDISDPVIVARFAERMGSVDRLRHLFVHTYCDARATAPGLWSSYKDSLHLRLYRGTLARLMGEASTGADAEPLRESLMAKSDELGYAGAAVTREELAMHLAMLPLGYLRLVDAEAVRLHATLIRRFIERMATETPEGALMPEVDWAEESTTELARVILVSWDRPGLFYRVCGVFALAGLSIHATRAFSRTDGIALDVFRVTEPDGSAPAPSREAVFLRHLRAVLSEHRDIVRPLADAAARARRARMAMRRPRDTRVSVEFDSELHRTVVEVRSPDRVGLLYDLGRVFFEHRRDIAFARIATESGYARDTFYLMPFRDEPEASSSDNESLRAALLRELA